MQTLRKLVISAMNVLALVATNIFQMTRSPSSKFNKSSANHRKISTHGIPIAVSDNGPLFASAEFKQFNGCQWSQNDEGNQQNNLTFESVSSITCFYSS